jgi:hypothetical protein
MKQIRGLPDQALTPGTGTKRGKISIKTVGEPLTERDQLSDSIYNLLTERLIRRGTKGERNND